MLYSQTRIKVASFSDSLPISNALIIINDVLTITADLKGVFILPPELRVNDKIKILASGYKDTSLTISDISPNYIIFLIPLNFSLPEITKSAKSDHYQSLFFKEKINIYDKSIYSSLLISDIFKIHSTFEVKDYGGPASLKTVSSRGMSSENTIVFFNEVRLNGFFSPSFDFSKLSSLSIKTIQTQKSGFDEGFFSPGGLIRISTGNFSDSLKLTLKSSYNNNYVSSGAISISDKLWQTKFSSSFERSAGQNNFEYFFENRKKRRKGTDFDKYSFVFESLSSLDNLSIKTFSAFNFFKIGIPGFVATNYELVTKAKDINYNSLNIINFNYGYDKNNYFFLSIYSSNSTLLIDDPLNYFNYVNNQKKSYLDDYGASLKITNIPLDNLFLNYGAYINFSTLKNKNDFIFAINPARYSEKFETNFFATVLYQFNTIAFFRNIDIHSSFSHTSGKETGTQYEKIHIFSKGAGMSFLFDFDFDLLLKFYYANSGRFPNFYERYYQNVTSHNYILKPEKYNWYEIGLFYSSGEKNNFEAGISWFSIYINDKIVWIPVRFTIQSPRNFAKVKSQGIDLSFSQYLFNRIINLGIKYSFVEALNKKKLSFNDNSYNKQIPYFPKHKASAFLEFSYKNIYANFSFLYNSRRYLTRDNDVFNSLDPFLVFDTSAGYKLEFRDFNIFLSLSVHNLFDAKYEIIKSYPMPLRTITINLTMEVL